jgi:hypothetical protein
MAGTVGKSRKLLRMRIPARVAVLTCVGPLQCQQAAGLDSRSLAWGASARQADSLTESLG